MEKEVEVEARERDEAIALVHWRVQGKGGGKGWPVKLSTIRERGGLRVCVSHYPYSER